MRRVQRSTKILQDQHGADLAQYNIMMHQEMQSQHQGVLAEAEEFFETHRSKALDEARTAVDLQRDHIVEEARQALIQQANEFQQMEQNSAAYYHQELQAEARQHSFIAMALNEATTERDEQSAKISDLYKEAANFRALNRIQMNNELATRDQNHAARIQEVRQVDRDLIAELNLTKCKDFLIQGSDTATASRSWRPCWKLLKES